MKRLETDMNSWCVWGGGGGTIMNVSKKYELVINANNIRTYCIKLLPAEKKLW